MFTPFRTISVALVALAAIVAVPALTSADSAREITVRDKIEAVKMIDVAPKSKGDRISLGGTHVYSSPASPPRRSPGRRALTRVLP